MASKRKKNTRDYGKTYGYDDGGKVDQMRDRGLRDLRRMMLLDKNDFGSGPGMLQSMNAEEANELQYSMERKNKPYSNRGRRKED